MGTTYSIKISEDGASVDSVALKRELDNILDDINSIMSTYIPDSELSVINQAEANKWLRISNPLVDILSISGELYDQTSGYFDITVGPLVNLWGFGPAENAIELPDEVEIQNMLKNVGMHRIHLQTDPGFVKKDTKEIYIDLSAIAKGYAVEKLAEHIRQKGMNNFLVEIGGEIFAQGFRTSEQPWTVAIENPSRESRSIHISIKLDNIGMATSGDYRNFRKVKDKYYSHSIDPHTGWPMQHKLASVTVLHPSTTYADALATGFLVMGKNKALEIARAQQLAVLFIERNGNNFIESHSPAMTQYIHGNQ